MLIKIFAAGHPHNPLFYLQADSIKTAAAFPLKDDRFMRRSDSNAIPWIQQENKVRRAIK